MPLSRYAVLVGAPGRYTAERHDTKSPHFIIDVEAPCMQGRPANWRASVNVKSRRWPSQVAMVRVESLHHDSKDMWLSLANGVHPIRHYPKTTRPRRNLALDYVRDDLFDYKDLTPVPAHRPGRSNDLMDAMSQDVIRTREAGGRVLVWGEPYNNHAKRGIHNVHQNQGNSRRYAKQNAVDQDGALMFQVGDKITAYFLVFQSQTYDTRNGSGISKNPEQTVYQLLCSLGRAPSLEEL